MDDATENTTPTDLLTRLRWLASEHWAGRHGLSDDMAVEIDRAAAEIERLRAALEYVASRQPDNEACHPTAGYSPEKACGLRVTRAREALRVGNPPATP